ncbi:MAG: Co2+/Mg2+ efflux protein ApaG [Ancalomicrobiaceae bacterium]|nr:Co2+/Mg2+ efflux protein ApaG [Ancalomicrobiaceae bacterium]
MYETITHDIRVAVTPEYLEDKSDPTENRWVWAYTIEITNLSDRPVQLRSRYWRITDARGRLQEVRGPGVVGEEPVIKPGKSFGYTSGCPLSTSSGIMVGEYEMEDETGNRFAVAIPAFSLDAPDERRRLN